MVENSTFRTFKQLGGLAVLFFCSASMDTSSCCPMGRVCRAEEREEAPV
jgi:hypothetical protein